MKLQIIRQGVKSGISLKGFRLDVLDIGFIILLGMMTYQGQNIQALCSTGFCGF